MITFDLRGTIIPFSLLEATSHFRKMAPGEVLEIISSDPGPARDLQRILPQGQFEVLKAETSENAGGPCLLRLKKHAPNSAPGA